jgi:uncharacterized protein YjbI with pentapeptide repeats
VRRLAALVTVLALVPLPQAALGAQDPVRERLEREKLEQEIAKLEREQGLGAQLPAWAGVLTALVALGGFALAWRQYRGDRRAERESEQEQRRRDRRERRRDSVRRFDESFAATVTNLGAQSPALRASAAASITALLKPEHRGFHDQVYEVFLANVRLPRGDLTDELLARAFALALRVHLDEHEAGEPPDLRDACLRGVDLSGLDLAGSRLADADLAEAVLAGANLRRVRAEGVDLTKAILKGADLEEARLAGATLAGTRLGGARLVSAKLQGAHARAAVFEGALLQDAHLEQADLRGARFRRANLKNAYFQGARFDDATLEGLAGNPTLPWEHFDDEVREQLQKRTGRRAPTGTPLPSPSVDPGETAVN